MLRHRVDVGEMVKVDRGVEMRRVVPRVRSAVAVEFRRDGDLGAVVDQIRGNRYVQVAAAVGSGKSTKIPRLIAEAMGKLVIHTIPFHISAHRLADYLKSTRDGEHVVYVDDIHSDLPSHGVAIMTNAHLLARVVNHGLATLTHAILYLDEIHESDCATAFFRDVAPTMGFLSVVKATATAGPGTAMRVHLPGARIENVYQKAAVATWSAMDNGKPWSVSSIQGNTLICVDRESVRTQMAADYTDQGFEVRVLTSKSTYTEYLHTEKLLLDPDSGIVVVLVDYAYRSSLTIPGLSRIVDSCEVAVPSTAEGAPAVLYRPAYDFEVQQFLGRGARLVGEKVELFKSAEPAPKFMCDLERLEADAANLLYRMCGYRPPMHLASFEFFEGSVPIDIAAALYGGHPARLCPETSRVPWINGHRALEEEKKKEVFVYRNERTGPKPVSCHTVVEKNRVSTPPPPVPDRFKELTVNFDGLDGYSSTRESASSERVYTVSDISDDGLSVFSDTEKPVFPKPARISARVRRERAEAEARLSGALEPGILPPAGVDVVTEVPVAGPCRPEESLPVKSNGKTVTTQADLLGKTATSAGLRRLGSVVHGVQDLHDTLDKRSKVRMENSVSDTDLGSYVHYHNMQNADTSRYFLNGLESVLTFVDSGGGRNAKGLPPDERLYAMRVLVDAFNSSTAIALGAQRILYEVSNRNTAEFHQLVDEEKMIEALRWVTGTCTKEQAKVRVYRDAMVYYMDYGLDIIEPATELEQRVMLGMMKKFDEAAVSKDPAHLKHYVASLNARPVRLQVTGSNKRRQIEF